MKFGFALLVFLLTFCLSLSRISPTISGGDSGELAGAGATLGIAHSPGYPLYCLLGKVFTFFFPFGNYAYRMNLMSAFFGSLTCVLIYLTIFSITGSILPAIISAFTLNFAKIFWAQNLVSEVFTLNTFFAALLVYLLIIHNSSFSIQQLYLFSFLFGLGLGNHHTLIFLFPGFAYLLYRRQIADCRLSVLRPDKIGTAEDRQIADYTLNRFIAPLLIAFCFFLLGLSVYLYIPLRSLQQPLFDWEDPETFDRFWGLVSRARYGTLQLAQGGGTKLNFGLIVKGIFFFFRILNENLTLLGTILFFVGSLFLFLKKDLRQTAIFLSLLLFFSGPFFLILSGVQTLAPGIKYILERFVTLSLVPTVIILGVGVEWILNRSRALRLGYLLVLGLPLFLFLKNHPIVNQRKNFFFYDSGINILRNANNGSIIFSDRADESEFALAYLLNAEGKRKDLEFIDCNAGVSRSIYGNDYYRIWGKPRLARREKIEKEIIERGVHLRGAHLNTKEVITSKEVYYSTLLPEQTAIPKYPDGLLYKVKPGKEKTNWQEFYFLRRPIENDIRGENLYLSYYNLLGKYFLQTGQLEQAKVMFTGLKTYGEKKDWIFAIAYSYYQKGYLKEAEEEYQEALAINPYWAEVLCNLGVIYEQKGDLEKAIDTYQRAILSKPDYAEAYYNLGVIYWKKGEWDKVVANFEKVLPYNPEHLGVKKYLPQAKLKLEEKK